jgi:hypothetical protein
MPEDLACQIKGYIQPFERKLAIRELEAMTGALARRHPSQHDVFLVDSPFAPDDVASRLTYWESVWQENVAGPKCFTRQVRNEATTYLVRNGVAPESLRDSLPFSADVPLPSRRNLRYGPHGIHEYRGKFFPQLVRSLLNISGMGPDCICLDPMCGSGTTPVETSLLGSQALAMDMNPLSVLVAKAKTDILAVDPRLLEDAYSSLRDDLLSLPPGSDGRLTWLSTLSQRDQDYLHAWFGADVLGELDPIATRVSGTSNAQCRRLFTVALSNILRRVSWQKNDDLRVRKEVSNDVDIDVVQEFLCEVGKSVRNVLALLHEIQSERLGPSHFWTGDARRLGSFTQLAGSIDCIVTSPPYATALPYLDTDRLSLIYLKLLSRSKHRAYDYEMIGNREVSTGRRQDYWERYTQRRASWPERICSVIDRIHERNQLSNAGFRRRNLPALLAQYFADMEEVLTGFFAVLKPGAPAVVVAGNNHTIADGERIEIETAQLLGELGCAVGLPLEEAIPMEMLVSRDIFRKNRGSSETILVFRRQ